MIRPRFAPIAWLLCLWLLLLSTVTFSATINVDSNADSPAIDGFCSLREALSAANEDLVVDTCTAGSGDDIILLPDNIYLIELGELAVLGSPLASNVKIQGNLSDPSLVKLEVVTPPAPDPGSRHFRVYGSNSLTLEGLTLSQGRVSGENGGSIFVEIGAQLNLTGSVVFDNNRTDQYGGAIANLGTISGVTATLAKFTSNHAVLGGGAIFNEGVFNVDYLYCELNTSDNTGGALHITTTTIISNGIFSNNSVTSSVASPLGGAIYSDDADLEVTNSYFLNNQAQATSPNTFSVKGGAIALTGAAQAKLIDVNFISNKVIHDSDLEAFGGAISSEDMVRMSVVTFSSNTSSHAGGALSIQGGSGLSNIADSSFTSNVATRVGGAIYNKNSSLDIMRSTLVLNQTLTFITDGVGGAGIYNDASSILNLENTTISGNYTGFNGGGLLNEGQANISFSTFADNSARIDVGGLLTLGAGGVNISNTIIANNTTSIGTMPDVGGTFNSLGFNLVLNTASSVGFSAANNDIIGQDPLLQALSINGSTFGLLTHALSQGSPAIDAATPTVADVPAVDQRSNYARPVDGNLDLISRADIGAYEFTPELTVFIDGVPTNSGSGSLNAGVTTQNVPIDSSFVIYNPGPGGASLSSFSLPAHFTLASAVPTGLSAGASATVVVRFLADAAGSFSGALSFTHTGTGTSPFTMTLAGTATELVDMNVEYQGNNLPLGSAVDAGITTLNTPINLVLSIFNPSSTVDLTVSAPTGLTADWTVVDFPTSPILPGNSADLTLSFNASAVGTYTSNLSIPNNSASKSPFNLILNAEVIAPPTLQASVDTVLLNTGSSVDFGQTTLNNSLNKVLILENTGSLDLQIDSLSLPAGFNSDFSGPQIISPGGLISVTLSLLADSLGTQSGTMSILSDDPNVPQLDLLLSGEVLAPANLQASVDSVLLNPGSSVDFGQTAQNMPINKTLLLENTGGLDLQISSISLPAGFSSDFVGPQTLSPGARFNVALTLLAQSIGNPSGTMSLVSDDPNLAQLDVLVSGEVVQPASLLASVDSIILGTSSSLDFGQTVLNVPVTKTLLLENTGAVNLQVSSISLPTGFGSDFVGPQTLSPGAAFNVQLTLLAQNTGVPSGTMSIISDDPNLPQLDVLLSGEVIQPGALQASVDTVFVSNGSSVNFGQTVLNTPLSKTLLLENTGDQDIQLDNLSTPAGFISAFPTPPYVLTPGSSLAVELQLEALSVGVFSGTMSLLSDAPNLPQLEINLTGEVIDNPGFELTQNASAVNDGAHIDFGQTTLGQAVTKDFLVSNSGDKVLSVDVSGTPDASFSLQGSFPMSIAPGSNASFSLTLEADSEGSYNSGLLLFSNDPEKPSLAFTFSGTVSAEPDPLPQFLENGTAVNSGALLDFGATPVGTPVTKTLTLVNNGNAVLQMSAAQPGSGFELVGAFPVILNPGESSNFSIMLAAQQAGSYTANLLFSSNSRALSSYQVSLQGRVFGTTVLAAQEPGGTRVLANGSVLDFGSALVGETLTFGLTFSNIGTAPLNLTGIRLNGEFIQLNTPESHLGPGESTTLLMELPTASVGLYSGTLDIDYVDASNSGADTQTMRFNLTGEVEEADPYYMPVEITLGQQTVGNTAAIGSNIGQFYTYELPIDPGTNTALSSQLRQGNDYRYSLVSGEGDTNNNMFSVSSAGLLNTAADFADLADVVLSIRVRSENAEGDSLEQSFSILVEADNLPPEQVILSPAVIEEGRPAGTFIGSLSAIDPNPDDVHSYQITGGANAADFIISGNVLMSARAFEYAVESALEVTITVQDQFNASISHTFSISVQQQSIRVQAFSAGWRHSCALLGDGSINCWGWNNFGQSSPPVQSGFRQLSLGSNHTCATHLNGSIQCWGSSDAGQAKSPSGNNFTSVSAGGNHNCALRDNQRIYCWGYNFEGQLNAPDEAGFIQVSSGGFHTCAIHQDGRLLCWGANNYGQSNVPDGAYTQVSAGEYHTCAVTDTRAVRCWGDDYRGQVSQTPSSGVFQSVSSGELHNCGLLESGEAICWGDNSHGQSSPPFDNQFTEISAGGVHTCGVRLGNSVACWGDNNDGQAAPPIAALNLAPENLQLSISSLPHLPTAGTVLGRFSAQDADTHDVLSYQLVSGESDQDNHLFVIQGSTLSTAADLTELRTYNLRVMVSDSNQGSAVQIFALGME